MARHTALATICNIEPATTCAESFTCSRCAPNATPGAPICTQNASQTNEKNFRRKPGFCPRRRPKDRFRILRRPDADLPRARFFSAAIALAHYRARPFSTPAMDAAAPGKRFAFHLSRLGVVQIQLRNFAGWPPGNRQKKRAGIPARHCLIPRGLGWIALNRPRSRSARRRHPDREAPATRRDRKA